jgi:hypothetical protein
MPISPPADIFGNLPSESFGGVHIMYLDIKKHATESVVNIGHESFAVFPLFPPGDEISPAIYPGDHARDILRMILHVGRIEYIN